MKIAFTGDLVFSGKFDGAEEKTGILDAEILSFLQSADYCVCDLEGPIYSSDARNDKVAIRSQPTIKKFLSSINGNVLFLGNNHILDYDEAGLKETLDFAEQNNILNFGAGYSIDEASKPLYLDDMCGMLAIRYNNKHARASVEQLGCLIWDEEEIIKKRIAEIKAKCTWCVLAVHGGDEFCMVPFPRIRGRYKKFLDWGADIIVAHHPHVAQNYEIVGQKIIFYSLGNFVFDNNYMREFVEAKDGILIKLDLQPEGYSWEYMPIFIDGDELKIKKTECPKAFNCIENETDYKNKVQIAITDFLAKERKNLKFQFKRKDIKTKAKARIILSHIKRYVLLVNNIRKYKQGKAGFL